VRNHVGTLGIFTCYVNIRKQRMSFSVGETQNEKPQSGFFNGMEAAARNRR